MSQFKNKKFIIANNKEIINQLAGGKKELYFIRHGETVWNVEGRGQGQEVAGGFKWEFLKDEEIEGEIWKVHASGGEFSNMGRCKFDGEIVKGFTSNEGFIRTTINKIVYSYHMEVAKLFVDNPKNVVKVRHSDGNKLNNRADNLIWVIRKR